MSPAKSNGMAGKAIERSNLYGLLATVFRQEPSLEFLRGMKSEALLDALAGVGVTLGADVLDSDADKLVEELAVEYARLFIGPGKHIPPYEAAQREGALWGKATSKVVAFLGDCGFVCAEEYSGIPDHISIELEFMQHMTDREAAAWKSGDSVEAQRCRDIESSFMRDHLGCWTPAFCEKVIDGAESTFYREMAELTRGFIESESVEFDKTSTDCPARQA